MQPNEGGMGALAGYLQFDRSCNNAVQSLACVLTQYNIWEVLMINFPILATPGKPGYWQG